jgi:hypothetical protein
MHFGNSADLPPSKRFNPHIGHSLSRSGIITLIGVLISKNVVGTQIIQAMTDLPAQLQTWLPQFLNGLMSPLQYLSIGFIAGGIVLLVASFIYKFRQTST